MKFKVSELTGAHLDYWVARSVGARFYHETRGMREPVTACVIQPAGGIGPWMGTQNWQAAKERYVEVFTFEDLKIGFFGQGVPRYSSDWAHGGPIIDENAIGFHPISDAEWMAEEYITCRTGRGPTPLIAAMRAYVVSKFGEEIEVES